MTKYKLTRRLKAGLGVVIAPYKSNKILSRVSGVDLVCHARRSVFLIVLRCISKTKNVALVFKKNTNH